MKSVLVLLFSILFTTSFSQTKVIAFKSHSGNMDNFSVAMESDLFNNDASNFGLPPNVITYRLDSVIYISSSATVLIQKVYSRLYTYPKDSAKFVKIKKDTLYNDPLFSRHHSLDSIKSILNTRKQYDNGVKKAIFIGYDNKKTKGEKKEKDTNTNEKVKENTLLPVAPINNDTINNNPFDTKMIAALGMIFLLALLGGWLSWKIANHNSKKDKPVLDKLAVT